MIVKFHAQAPAWQRTRVIATFGKGNNPHQALRGKSGVSEKIAYLPFARAMPSVISW